MIREILFRGKPIYEETIIGNNFYYGDLCHYANGEVTIRQPETGYEMAVVPETIGQFTGITDRNGKKIFEGDIIKTDLFGKNHFISFGKSAKWGQCFCVQSNNSIIYLTEIYAKSSDIIGDLYSNPELLDSF